MKAKLFYVLSLVLLLATCGRNANQSNVQGGDSAATSAYNEDAENSAKSDGANAVAEEDRPTVIDFNATWCPPCQQIKPVFESLEKEYSKSVNFKSVDVDENPEMARQYNIESIPTFIFLNSEGKEINRLVGADEQTLKSILQSLATPSN